MVERLKPCETRWQRKWLDLEITHPAVQDVATAAEQFCKRWFNNNREQSLLVLVGDSGTCKTHLARRIDYFCRAAAPMAFDRGMHGSSRVPDSMYLHWPSTVAKFGDKKVGNMIVDDASSCTLRIIDDIGAEQDPWGDAKDRLCQILSRSEDRFTVITTNISPRDWANKFDTRIADRLLRNSVVKQLRDVPSYAMWKRTATKKGGPPYAGP